MLNENKIEAQQYIIIYIKSVDVREINFPDTNTTRLCVHAIFSHL